MTKAIGKRTNYEIVDPSSIYANSVERLKRRHYRVLRALFNDLKRKPQGISDLARLLDRNPVVTINQLRPTSFDQAPSLGLVLDLHQLIRSRQFAEEVARYANCTTYPLPTWRYQRPPTADAARAGLREAIAQVLADLDQPMPRSSADRHDCVERIQALIAAAVEMEVFDRGIRDV